MTAYFIMGLVLVITFYDFYIIKKKGKYNSISAFIIRWSKKYASIPFLLGFICGHLFWSMDTGESQFEGAKLDQYKQCISKIK